MFSRTRTSLIVVLCALALLASACGGASAGEVTTGSNDAEPTTEVDAADNDDPQTESTQAPSTSTEESSGSDTPAESPLGDLLGIPITDDEAMEQWFENIDREAQTMIAECMISQGFEYKLVDLRQVSGLDNNIDFESREFAEEYGFGIASNPFEESFEALESFKDPNAQIIAQMTEGEREAYMLALSGELPDFDDIDPAEGFEPGGCEGEAYSTLFGFVEIFNEFGNEFEEIEEAYNADPRIVEASSGWSACVAESGYSYSDIDAAEADIQRRYDAIVDTEDAYVSEDDVIDSIEVDSAGQEEEFFFGPRTLKPEFQAQVDELAVEERAVATASWDCNGPLREIGEAVQLEYEQKFVDENGAAIAAALAE